MQHDQIFYATGRSDDGRAYWSEEAVSLGYKSESAWKKSGRKVLPSAVPSVVVGQVSRGVGRPMAPILRDLGKDEYDYAADYFCVYAESDTVVLGSTGGSSGSRNSKTEDQPTATTTECSPPTILPYVAGFFDKDIQGKDLVKTDSTSSKTVNNRPSRRDRKAEEWEYLPEGFDWRKVPKSLIGGMKYLFHVLYLKRVIRNELDKDDFININAETLRKIVHNGHDVRKWALKSGLVECDNTYAKGTKSLGYRLCKELTEVTWRLTRRTNRVIVGNLKKTETERSPVVKWMTENLKRVEAVMPDDLPFADQLPLMAINEGCVVFNAEDDFGGRFHSNLTNLRKDLKRHLRVDGKPLWQIDIKNSQPLFLATVAATKGVDCPEYRQMAEQGQVYETVAAVTGLERREQKQEMLLAYFSKNTVTTPTKRALRRKFPEIYELIRDIKADDHAELARQLQRAESDFIVRTVCDRLRRQHRRMFVATIHDCIVTDSPENAETVRQVMLEEFAKMNLGPILEIEEL